MDLQDIRREIDNIDTQITDLFRQRMQLCGAAAENKARRGASVLDETREREILSRLGTQAGEPLEMYIRALYTVVFGLSRSYQAAFMEGGEELTRRILHAAEHTEKIFPRAGSVACQGVDGAYSQIACRKIFPMPDIQYCRSFEDVFRMVEDGRCQYGVLPIENSTYGSVTAVYDLMCRYHFHIVRGVKLPIRHNLLAKPGVKPEDIREIVSHEQAIGQCSVFLNKHPEIKVTVCENTAVAAKLAAESGRTDLAALASPQCAELYGLTALSAHVQNCENNYTRFICITKEMKIYPGSDRVSLMLSLPHEPGSLYRIITRFAALGLNLTKLESRPIPGRDFEFLFYFDLEASVRSPKVIRLLGECSADSELFVFLGGYSEI